MDNDTINIDIDHLRTWIGQTETDRDFVTRSLVRSFNAAVLDIASDPVHGDIVPQSLHWCLTPRTAPMSQLGEDGHPARGDFLPPVPLPRRMWAGSRIRFLDDILVGDEIVRESKIKDVTVKSGRSGTLCFVVLSHAFSTERGVAVEEEQDIVYREGQTRTAVPTSQAENKENIEEAAFQKKIDMTPPLLFRYSALTFNGHRIHYDRTYATEVEHYGGLVVHGPLQASLLLDLASTMRRESRCQEFSFRGMRPLLDHQTCLVNAEWTDDHTATLWTGISKSAANMTANATWPKE